MTNGKINKRKVARFIVEAVTPLAVGSGEGSVMTDSVVALDFRGLPYIPGTSLTGVLRHAVSGLSGVDRLFGKQDGIEASGSRIIISEARIVDFDGTVVDGIVKTPSRDLMSFYADNPVRQHVCIGHKGVTEGTGKFDNQVVCKGTRFCFDMECILDEIDDEKLFNDVISVVIGPGLRVGGGVRKGYGRLEVRGFNDKVYDLDVKEEMDEYFEHSSKLTAPVMSDDERGKGDERGKVDKGHKSYQLKLSPEDFVFFGSGLGNKNADSMALAERYVHWVGNKGTPKMALVFPGSSIKGAFAHRFRYWFNVKDSSGKGDEASRILFGYVQGGNQVPGLIYFEDVILPDDDHVRKKVFNHVKIDRFTGGSFPGALYNEEAVFMKDVPFELIFALDQDELENRCALQGVDQANIEKAIDLVIRDIGEGLLPLGGLTNRGHGCFKSVK